MKELETAAGVGREIIKRLHEFTEEQPMDDSEYIPLIKMIIEAINTYVSKLDLSKSENEDLQKTLFTYAKDLYVELYLIHAEEQEGISNNQYKINEYKEEAEEVFDYIYKHEEHPGWS
jgi:hypothetical protein